MFFILSFLRTASEIGLDADPRALSALCELVENDIRASLNALQFVRAKGAALTMQSLQGLRVGEKDLTKGNLELWEAVFDSRTQPHVTALQRSAALATHAPPGMHGGSPASGPPIPKGAWWCGRFPLVSFERI
jgi:hypothetical protein